MIKWTGEAEQGFPYWWEGKKPEPYYATKPPAKCELLIIGAGYTGLSAAIAAHDAGARVVLVDAGIPGQGASTRNGGMFGAHPRHSWSDLDKNFGRDIADGLFAEANTALDFVTGLIAREKIDCDLQQTGRVQLAWTKPHFERHKRLVEEIRTKSQVKVDLLQREDLAEDIATKKYFGGIRLPEHYGIHPRKFHEGLMAAVLGRDIPVIANCCANRTMRTDGKFIVETDQGIIRADKVVMATNGYTKGSFAWHKARVFPLPSYIIATEELPQNLIKSIAPGGRMMVETRARHSYYRVSPDGKRILFGGRASMRKLSMPAVAQRLHDTMCEIWPELTGTKLSHVWWGNTGYSFTHMPQVGENDGVHFAMGYSGSGTVMAPYLGAKAGLRAIGAKGGETAYADTKLRTRWLHPTGKPHFLKAADLWYRNVVDHLENFASRQG